MNKLFLSLGLGVVVLAACNMNAVVIPTYKAAANGANEKPTANTSTGTATLTATLDGTTLNLKVDYSGLTGVATLAHIHGPADETAAAGVVCDFTSKLVAGATVGSGSITAACLVDAKLTVADLDAGKLYLNIHTAANGGGEVRGQLKKQ
jgi:CHRD domain